MTAVLTFWLMQSYTYNSQVDKHLLTKLSNSLMMVQERSIETVRNESLSGAQIYNLDNILANNYAADTLISNNFESQCFYENPINSGNIVSGQCYDVNLGGGFSYDYDTTHYEVKSILTADPNIGWIQMVSYLDMDIGTPIEQRDLYSSFVNDMGYNLNMGLVSSGDRNGGDYLVNTGELRVTDRTVSSAAWNNGLSTCANKDINNECFIVVTDIAQIPVVPDRQIIVDISDVDQHFDFDGTNYDGALFNSSNYNPRDLTFTVDDDNNGSTNPPNVNLYVSISGYDADGNLVVPPTSSDTGNGYNNSIINTDGIEFIDSNGNIATNETGYTHNMSVRLSPNYNQVGGAYITITAVYAGTDADKDNSILIDRTTFLVMVENEKYECDEHFLESGSLKTMIFNGEKTYIIGDASNPSDTTAAVQQLLCLSKIQGSVPEVLTSNYVLSTDVNFDINFSVSKRYQDENGNGNSSTKTGAYRYIKSLTANVNSNNMDWDLDEIIDSTATKGWIPIGDNAQSLSFEGKFYGQGHTIRNLYMKTSNNRAMGLFGVLHSATVSDINFDNVYIENSSNSIAGTPSYSGVLAGGSSGNSTIERVNIANSSLNITSGNGGKNNIGGLIGSFNSGSLNDCNADTDVVVSGNSVGGLLGSSLSGTITGSSATGDVYASGNNVGGLIGNIVSATTNSNNASGNIFSDSVNAGGLIGFAYTNPIYSTTAGNNVSSSYATGYVSARGEKVGGLIGSFIEGTTGAASVINCRSLSPSVKGSRNIGGLIGYVSNDSFGALNIKNSYSLSSSVRGSSKNIGGLIGYAYKATLDNARASSLSSYMSIVGTEAVGGLIGWTQGSTLIASKAYVDKISGNIDVGGYIGYAMSTSITSPTVRIKTISEKNSGSGNAIGGYIGHSYTAILINPPSISYASGALIKGTKDIGGLIGFSEFSRLRNLYASGDFDIKGTENVGGVVGRMHKSNIENSGIEDVNFSLDGSNIGGLVGLAEESSNIIGSVVDGGHLVIHSSYDNLGGIVGLLRDSDVLNSYFKGVIEGYGSNIGGIVGYAYKATIEKSYSNVRLGAVLTYTNNAGGIAGLLISSTISSSFSIGGAVIAASTISKNAGGLVGSSSSSNIVRSFAAITVSGTSGVTGRIGGIVGSASNTNISQNLFNGGVSAGLSDNIGGIIGSASSSNVNNSYVIVDDMNGIAGPSNIGGIIGSGGSASNSYIRGGIYGQSYVGGLMGNPGSASNSYIYGNVKKFGETDSSPYYIYGSGANYGTNKRITGISSDGPDFLEVTKNWSESIWKCLKDDNMSPVLKNTAEVIRTGGNYKLAGLGLKAMGWDNTWNNTCSSTPNLTWEGKNNTDTCVSSACSGVPIIVPDPDPTSIMIYAYDSSKYSSLADAFADGGISNLYTASSNNYNPATRSFSYSITVTGFDTFSSTYSLDTGDADSNVHEITSGSLASTASEVHVSVPLTRKIVNNNMGFKVLMYNAICTLSQALSGNCSYYTGVNIANVSTATGYNASTNTISFLGNKTVDLNNYPRCDSYTITSKRYIYDFDTDEITFYDSGASAASTTGVYSKTSTRVTLVVPATFPIIMGGGSGGMGADKCY